MTTSRHPDNATSTHEVSETSPRKVTITRGALEQRVRRKLREHGLRLKRHAGAWLVIEGDDVIERGTLEDIARDEHMQLIAPYEVVER